MSEQWQEEDASLRNYEREQADLERQTDALVLKTLASLVSAAEDMKARLRRDTDSLLEEFHRTKRGLENDISMAGAERQRLRDEAESERDRIVNEARSESERVVREAQQERESLLGEVRESQGRLRALEAQILQVLGAARGVGVTAGPAATEQQPTDTAPLGQSMAGAAGVALGVATTPSPLLVEPMPSIPATAPVYETLTPPAGTPAPSIEQWDDLAGSDPRVDTTRLVETEPGDHFEATTTTFDAQAPEPIHPAASVSSSTAAASPVTARDEPELSFASASPAHDASPTATPLTRTDEMVEVPAATAAASTPPPSVEPPVVTSSSAPTTPPAAGSTPEADETSAAGAAPASRPLQLVFDGVPGYQQAAAIERAVGDLVEDSEVEIIEFEQGQLVLQIEATDPRALADRLMARPPLPMRLVASGQDSATFQLTAG